MTKGYLILDLAAFHGGATFVPGRQRPRGDKAALELQCATTLLEHLRRASGIDVQNIRSNPSDPPDVLFESSGITIGVELVELLPVNRLAKDHQLAALRDRILDRLLIGEVTRNWVINIMLADDYAPKLPHRRDMHEVIALAIADSLDRRMLSNATIG